MKPNATPPVLLLAVLHAVQTRGRRDALGDCGATYRAVFAAANRSMKTAPAGDGQPAGQIDALLED